MQAFLYLDLTVSATYIKPLLGRVKQQLPEVAVLDIDAQSDELLRHYALRLLRESDKAVIYIQADAATTGFGSMMPLLEELFQEQPNKLILLQGDYPRLLRMLRARPQVQFKQVKEDDVLEEVELFLGETLQ
jgi:hypothetical protein